MFARYYSQTQSPEANENITVLFPVESVDGPATAICKGSLAAGTKSPHHATEREGQDSLRLVETGPTQCMVRLVRI